MKFRAVVAAVFLIALEQASAVILFDTDDPAANTSADGTIASNVWPDEGIFGSFLGTPIAPRFFLSAKHVGNQGSLVFGSASYPVIAQFGDPTSDLEIDQVGQDLPIIAPMYMGSDEAGKHLVVIGRGTQRGGVIMLNGTPRGWSWGQPDGVERWGENDVAAVVNFSSGPDDAIYATFDQRTQPGTLPNECHLSSGDSSGAVFINENGTWKVAGINYAVDDLYSAPDPKTDFSAAIFDARGYYNRTGDTTFELIDGPVAVPTGFYATRISSKLPWIYSIIDPQGDFDGNGIPNLLQYAISLNSATSDPARQPLITENGGNVFFTYRKITNAATLHYQIEQSTDLAQWSPATTQETVTGTSENVATISAQIATDGKAKLFLRLSITQD